MKSISLYHFFSYSWIMFYSAVQTGWPVGYQIILSLKKIKKRKKREKPDSGGEWGSERPYVCCASKQSSLAGVRSARGAEWGWEGVASRLSTLHLSLASPRPSPSWKWLTAKIIRTFLRSNRKLRATETMPTCSFLFKCWGRSRQGFECFQSYTRLPHFCRIAAMKTLLALKPYSWLTWKLVLIFTLSTKIIFECFCCPKR